MRLRLFVSHAKTAKTGKTVHGGRDFEIAKRGWGLAQFYLGGGFKYIFIFTTTWGRFPF